MSAAQSNFSLRPQHRVIVLLGPTASGKSTLGVALAKKFHGVIISADSRQVYRGLDIGTAKITRSEMDGVPHHLLGVASPRTQYSVARYVRDVRRVLRDIPVNIPVFLVGGSPFYIDALTKPGSYSSVPPNLKLRRRLVKKTLAQAIELLRKLQPGRLSTIDIANRRRLIRAIEIALYQPPPHVRRGEGEVETFSKPQVLKLGLNHPRQKLFRAIDHRVDQRWIRMVKEVRKLHADGLAWTRLDSFGLEYRYVSRYVGGELNKDEAIRQLKTASHDFVRRQLTWWKRDKHIHWVSTSDQARRLVKTFLRPAHLTIP